MVFGPVTKDQHVALTNIETKYGSLGMTYDKLRGEEAASFTDMQTQMKTQAESAKKQWER